MRKKKLLKAGLEYVAKKFNMVMKEVLMTQEIMQTTPENIVNGR